MISHSFFPPGTRQPFIINFRTDNFEVMPTKVVGEAVDQDPGFILGYTMDSIRCGVGNTAG